MSEWWKARSEVDEDNIYVVDAGGWEFCQEGRTFLKEENGKKGDCEVGTVKREGLPTVR